MKFTVSLLLTALLSFATGLFTALPWWSFSVCAFVVALTVHQKAWKAFLSGFLSLFLLWGLMAAAAATINGQILATRVAEILSIGSPVLLIVITAIIGGLVAGFAAMTGSYLRHK